MDLASRFANWLGGKPPSVWASIYLLLIPLAGIVYWTLPAGSFYDSNLVREAGFKQDLVDVADLLTNAIGKQEYGYVPGHPLPAPVFDTLGTRLMVDINTVDVPVESISVDTSGHITLGIRFFARSAPPFPFVQGELSDLVTLSPVLGSETIPGQPELAMIPTSLATASGSGSVQAPLNILLPQVAGVGLSPDRSMMLVPLNAAVVVERLSAAGGGDPKYASGLLVRMCYFSVITITTLGFGDITPVSSTARALVAVEAILGVVSIGLFLNAVAHRWKQAAAAP